MDWLDPTPEMLATPEFEAIWQCIKTWDINVPAVYEGYMGANGNHVRAILDALTAIKNLAENDRFRGYWLESAREQARAEERERWNRKARDMRSAIDAMELAMMGWPELVDLPEKWGEPRHRSDVKVSIPGTVEQVYRICDALSELTRIINSPEYQF